ncbi:TPA: MlaD family protein [Legionella pneumophila]|uniref:ABC transport system periplasmic substrate binding protein n=1 Tax=Legionella pneumophila subsp. pneumophila (strain Philadelphia 1 / ATCC 33152 / DSM 7513) TaxID=272624 RepID=Q5ZTW3_LEGPH|nr:MlaD family protein [Legionella pneumophila]AAU28114.1 ABC transport system periplasmic substrate binding protein [Legionella pneumophila subsp. pneumophila str. Philadelphia 1]AOU11022.1 ABC transporter substrate-binding protein [Legionella pneumophila]AOU13912.1 ABC transporter substrate-binding protein [Legionella pneumophila]AOU16946.1 ABC transporter substrate-binding protein [Legionella pneumophila]AOU19907.1 ABC transporter substrate-binding protein [Legionella pneumophila]
MESKTNYTIVGLIVLILTAGLLSAGLWLSVGFNQKEYTSYTVYLKESVSGLSVESPVKFNGVQVGYVKEIKLNKNDPRQVELLLNIEKSTPITTSTSATLITQGITGVTYVGLSAGSSELTPLRKMPGEPYPVIPSKPSLLNQLDAVLKEVAENVGAVSEKAQLIFNEENADNVRKSLANLERITEIIADKGQTIDSSLNNLDVFVANMANASKQFPQLIKDLKTGISKFKSLADNMSAAGKDVSKTMIAGKNTIDQISQQAIPPAVILLRRLNAISANLEKVSNEMRQNPSVIIRGTKAPKLGPGE